MMNKVYQAETANGTVVAIHATVQSWAEADALADQIKQELRRVGEQKRARREARLIDPRTYGLAEGDEVAVGTGRHIYKLVQIGMSYKHPGEAEATLRRADPTGKSHWLTVNPSRLVPQNMKIENRS